MPAPKKSLSRLVANNPPKPKMREPLWEGPLAGTGHNGGVTQSMLKSFLTCRERFRVRYVEGLRPADAYHFRMEYGSCWHACEEAFAAGGDWRIAAATYSTKMRKRYPMDQQVITHWENVCVTQFGIYVDYWKDNDQVKVRTPLLQEQTFDVPYKLPSGRVVRLRGRWDAVDLIGTGKTAAVYLFETKTKGDIDPGEIQRQLSYDLQTMIYLVSLQEYGRFNSLRDAARKVGAGASVPIAGVRYNTVRRPLSGGKGSIVRHKATKTKPEETPVEFYARLGDIIRETPGDFFTRFQVEVSPADIARFRRQCLDPILEQLCDWWEFIMSTGRTDPFCGEPIQYEITGNCPASGFGIHWRHPFGADNAINEYGATDIDGYLDTGARVGLEYAESLFTELQ